MIRKNHYPRSLSNTKPLYHEEQRAMENREVYGTLNNSMLHIPVGGTYGEWSLKSFSVKLHEFIHLCFMTCVVSFLDLRSQQMLLNLWRWPFGQFTPLQTVHWVQNIKSHTEYDTLCSMQSGAHSVCKTKHKTTHNVSRAGRAVVILHGRGKLYILKTFHLENLISGECLFYIWPTLEV